MRWLFGVCAIVVALVTMTACGPSDSDSNTSVDGPVTTSVTATTTVPPTSGDASVADSTATTTASPTTVAGAEPYFAGLDIALVTLLPVGEDDRPVLSWDPMDDAVEYMVLVMDPEGSPWWVWTGTDNSVVLGGVDTDAEIGGPRAMPGVTWVVFAYDDRGALIGASPEGETGQ